MFHYSVATRGINFQELYTPQVRGGGNSSWRSGGINWDLLEINMNFFSILFCYILPTFSLKKTFILPSSTKKTKQFFCIQRQLSGFFSFFERDMIFKENKHPSVFIICWQQRYTINMFKNVTPQGWGNGFLMLWGNDKFKIKRQNLSTFLIFLPKTYLFPLQILFSSNFANKTVNMM